MKSANENHVPPYELVVCDLHHVCDTIIFVLNATTSAAMLMYKVASALAAVAVPRQLRLDAVCVLRFSPDMACACVHGICATKSVCDNITPGCSAEHASSVFPHTRNVAEGTDSNHRACCLARGRWLTRY